MGLQPPFLSKQFLKFSLWRFLSRDSYRTVTAAGCRLSFGNLPIQLSILVFVTLGSCLQSALLPSLEISRTPVAATPVQGT